MLTRSSMNRRVLVRAGWVLVWLMATIRLLASVAQALEQAPVFQWAAGEGHLFYLVRLALSTLPGNWAQVCWLLVNLAMLRVVVIKARGSLRGRVSQLWWAGAALLLCTGFPVADVLVNGQAALFSLFGLTMCFLYRRMPVLAGVGLALVMSSFASGLVVAGVMLVAGFVDVVAIAALISAAAWLVMSYVTGGDIWACLWQPLMGVDGRMPVGAGDWISVCRVMSGQFAWPAWVGGTVAIVVNAAFAMLLWTRRRLLMLHGAVLARALGAAVLLALGSLPHARADTALGLFFLWALLLNGKGRVDTVFVQALLGLFVLLWLAPGMGAYLPMDPFTDYRVMMVYALVLMVSAFGMGVLPMGHAAAARVQAPWWAALIDPAADEAS